MKLAVRALYSVDHGEGPLPGILVQQPAFHIRIQSI
jgi:hypothetical protein